ncbi:MAG: DUF1573 domain-containing protein [Cyanobacteria bacterium HKST-UBA04]|nr:DUF1573 domain-containing protein [Cyanobacteria bacterium HKST-UBA04]
MNRQRLLILLALVLLAGLSTGLFTLWKNNKALQEAFPLPRLVSRQDPPQIHTDSQIYDMGTILEGVEVPYTLTIQNLGGEPLVINHVDTSCGCTLLNLKDKVIAPGKQGELGVVMDTSLKQGPVRKTIIIESNDPKTPKLSIVLSALVIANLSKNEGRQTGLATAGPAIKTTDAGHPLPTLVDLDTQTKNGTGGLDTANGDPHANLKLSTPPLGERETSQLFLGRCATCHVTPGQGKYGNALFKADCAMCHGLNALGPTDKGVSEGSEPMAPALIPRPYDDPAVYARLKKIIEYGSPFHPSMPAFLEDNGGPLSQAQIDSLLTFLKQASDNVDKKAKN